MNKCNLYLISESVSLNDSFVALGELMNNLEITFITDINNLFEFNFEHSKNIIIYDLNLNHPKIIESLKVNSKNKKFVLIFYSDENSKNKNISLDFFPFGFINQNHSISQLSALIKTICNYIDEQIELSNYKAVFEISKDANFITDKNGLIKKWNNSAQRIFGWKLEDIIEKPIFDKIIPDEFLIEFKMSFNQWVNSISPEFVTKTIEIYGQKNNLYVFPIELTMARYNLDNELMVAFFSRDITERINSKDEIDKLIEEMVISKEVIEQNANELIGLNHELYESQLQLKEINASKDKFFSIIAHDLKGPFQNLLGYTDILSKDIKNLDIEEIEELATNLNLSAIQLFKLLENLLHWSRIQRGAIEYTPDECPLGLIFKQNLDLIKQRAHEKKIELRHFINDELIAYCDINMLNTVIRNLLSNALKFTSENGVIEIIAKQFHENFILIEINDSGVGIPSNKILKLFRIDQSVSTQGTKNEQGTGLGLILCKELVENNGGEIFVESIEGKGTSFKFTVPKLLKN